MFKTSIGGTLYPKCSLITYMRKCVFIFFFKLTKNLYLRIIFDHLCIHICFCSFIEMHIQNVHFIKKINRQHAYSLLISKKGNTHLPDVYRMIILDNSSHLGVFWTSEVQKVVYFGHPFF